MPVLGSILITIWLGSGSRLPLGMNASFGGCLKTSRTSVCLIGMRLPVRMKNGTPAQRQLSISSLSAA